MKFVSLRLVAALALTFGVAQSSTGFESSQPLFFTPAAKEVPQVIDAIRSAKTSLHMIMFRISTPAIIDELIAAHNRGVDVQVILDNNGVKTEKPGGAFSRLTDAGVKAMKSSAAFSISHAKSFIVDNSTLYIMTLNLTTISATVRDVGYITNDPTLISFYNDLFKTDSRNSDAGTTDAPATIPDNIVLAPGARDRLVQLIGTARNTIKLEVENFSDQTIAGALTAAAKRGVKVQVMMPRCDMVQNDFDMPMARTLTAAGIEVRLMPGPMTAEDPYIHQKSFSIDGSSAFLGSENFSLNSLDKSRELGVILSERAKVRQLDDMFDKDFSISLNMTDAETFKCPSRSFDSSTPVPGTDTVH